MSIRLECSMVSVSLVLRRAVRGQDVVWLLLFMALAFVADEPWAHSMWFLLGLAAFQILEPRVPSLSRSGRGRLIAVLLKLALCYLLIGWTGGISSSYYVILLLPVVSAATTMPLPAVLLSTLAACAAYMSFLLPVYIDWTRYELTRGAIGEVGLRVIFLPVVAYLTWQLAQENRTSAQQYQAAAADLATARDNLRAAEAAVRRSERLAALGQLTAGLAHELRNPLGTMRASAELLSRQLPSDRPVATELAGFIASEVDRTNSLITRFLEFAKPLRLQVKRLDITMVLDAAIQEFERHVPPLPVSVHRNYLPDLPWVTADAELLQCVFLNLLLNAAQASPAGATITVKARGANEYVQVAVLDRGKGIAEKDLEQIFNPFFTTRADGVGLGLAIVSRIVDEHGGHIDVQSAPGEGTAFLVVLPVKAPAHADEGTEATATVDPGRL